MVAYGKCKCGLTPGDAAMTGRATSTRAEAPVDGLSLVRQSPLSTGLSEESSDIVLASRRDSTERQYLVYVHTCFFYTKSYRCCKF